MSISVTISFSLVALLLVHLSNAETIEVFWNMPDLASRNNQVHVCVGDVLNLTCPGSSESIIAGKTMNDFNMCTSDCDHITEYIGSCSLQGFIIENINTAVLNCEPLYSPGSIVYLLGADQSSCNDGYKLEVSVKSAEDCIITSSTGASTAVAMTTGGVGGVMISGNTASQSSTTTTSTSGNATPTIPILTTTMPINSTGMIGSATATPNIGGIGNDGSTAFFSSWSIGVQVGSVLGVLVGLIVIAVCIVGGIVCAVKTRNRTGEKDLLGHEDVDSGKFMSKISVENSNEFSNTGYSSSTPTNRIKPAPQTSSVTSPSRPPPAPPNGAKKPHPHSNGNGETCVTFKPKKDEVSLGGVVSPRRTAPGAPPSYSQSVQNNNRKPKPIPPLKSM